MNMKVLEYVGYVIVVVGIICGVSLSNFPVMDPERQFPLHAMITSIGLLIVLITHSNMIRKLEEQ